MSKLKTPLIVAGVSCLLSMFIGMISGVRFLNILMRGIVAGVGVGGFVLGARLLLEKVIPDLFTQQNLHEPVETMDTASGTNVNITLDDDRDMLSGDEDVLSTKKSDEVKPSDGVQTRPKDETAGDGTVHHDTGSAMFSASPALSFSDNSENDSSLSDFPDMEEFMETDEVSDNGLNNVGSASSNGFSVSGIQPADTDSKVMAQAIRTILVTED